MKFTLITLLVLFLTACGGSRTQTAIPPVPEEGGTAATPQEIDAATIYAARCARCHGADRSGNNGPALLPEQLDQDPAVYQSIIINGNGPMPAWGGRLSAEEISVLVDYILSNPE
jgi:mono/diheme cytochrome c family protein